MRTRTLLAVLVLSTALRAQEREADRVLAAFGKKDWDGLSALARAKRPDPWIVAALLGVRGKHDAALAFAKASPRRDTVKLAAHVAARKADGRPAAASDWATFVQAQQALWAHDPSGAMGKLARLDTKPKDVISVRAIALLASIKTKQRDSKASRDSHVDAARRALGIGWVAFASAQFDAACKASAKLKDWKTLHSLAKERITVEEQRDDPVSRAHAVLDEARALHGLGNRDGALYAISVASKVFLEHRDRQGAKACRALRRAVVPRSSRKGLQTAIALQRAGMLLDDRKYEEAKKRFLEILKAAAPGSHNKAYAHFGLAGAYLGLRKHHEMVRHLVEAHGRFIKLKDAQRAAHVLVRWARIHIGLGEPKHALQLLEEALPDLDPAKDIKYIARATMSRSQAHELAGSYAEARKAAERALRMYEKSPRRTLVIGPLIALRRICVRLGDYESAQRYQHRYDELIRNKKMSTDERESTLVIQGMYHASRGDPGAARKVLERSLAKLEQERYHWIARPALLELADTYLKLGNTAKAADTAKRALRLAAESGHGRQVAAALSILGSTRLAAGDHTGALALTEEALFLRRDIGDLPGTADSYVRMAELQTAFGDWSAAAELQLAALDMFRRMGDRPREALVLASLGQSFGNLGRRAAARGFLMRAIALQRELDNPALLASVLAESAQSQLAKGDGEGAAETLGGALQLFRDLGNRRGVVRVRSVRARALRIAGKIDASAAETASALREARSLGLSKWVVYTLAEQAHIAAHRKQPEAALALAHDAVDAMTKLGLGLRGEQRGGLREQFATVFAVGTEAARRLGKTRDLAFFLEAGRAGSLLEAFAADRRTSRVLTLAEQYEARERAKREAVRWNRYRAAVLDRTEAGIAARREALLAQFRRIQTAIAQMEQAESKRVVRPAPTPATVEELQGSLGPEDALVLYGGMTDQAVALVILPNAARIVSLGHSAVITKAAGGDLSDPKHVQKLRQMLVSVLKVRGKRRLLVSPVGALSFLPFVLIAPGFEVAMIPSGTTFRLLKQERRRSGKGKLVLAIADGRGGTRATPGGERVKLEPLPAAEPEAQAVGDATLLGAKATKRNITMELQKQARWRAIHFACHASSNPERPGASVLVIAPENRDDPGLLTAYEVFRMRFSADLVVLSACETGRGRFYAGEGTVGFASTFLEAGASRVLVSLWRVDDAATRALMERFYTLWKPDNGIAAAAALRQAMNHIRANKKWKHPAFWAAWQLWGPPD